MIDAIEPIMNICKLTLLITQFIATVYLFYRVADYFSTQESVSLKNRELQKQTICDGCKNLTSKYYSDSRHKVIYRCRYRDFGSVGSDDNSDRQLYCSHCFPLDAGITGEEQIKEAIIKACEKCGVPYKKYGDDVIDFAVNGILVTRKDIQEWSNNAKG